MKRLPRGYVGRNHETIGSDILSFLKVLPSSQDVLDLMLGRELSARLREVKPDGWYPAQWLMDSMEAVGEEA